MSDEPSPGGLGGVTPVRVIRRFFLATRPQFLSASVLPVLLGTAWGWHLRATLDVTTFALVLATVVCVHGGTNALNDVHDQAYDDDNVNHIPPYTGGSRFIQNGIMDARTMARWAWSLLAFGIAFGIALAALRGLAVIGFGLAGLALGIFYSVPPVRLSDRGLGILAVALAFGILPVTGAAWVQSAPIGPGIVLLSLAVSLWIAAVLLINQVPDVRADSTEGKRTLAVRLGPTRTGLLYRWLQVGAAAITLATAFTGHLPIWAVAVPIALLLPAWKAGTVIIEAPDDPVAMKKAIQATIGIHGTGTLWLMLVVVFF